MTTSPMDLLGARETALAISAKHTAIRKEEFRGDGAPRKKKTKKPSETAYHRRKGDPMTPMMKLSSTVSWLQLATKGAAGSIDGAMHNVALAYADPDVQLPHAKEKEFQAVAKHAHELAEALRTFSEEVAKFNKGKVKRTVEGSGL